MFKNIQLRIVIVFFLIGIITIAGLGTVYINSINVLENNINSQTTQNIGQVIEYIQQMKSTNITAIIVVSIIFAIGGLLTAIILSKFVIYPINKLIKSAEKITEEENKRENTLETILLHMTDGIIAFNMEGEIILINPAAKKFLSIGPEDITFDDIFSKFKLGINLEKIIYLDNWTSTEQRIQVEDKYMKVFFAPFKNQSSRPDGVIAVVQDITEHVRLDNVQKEFVADVSHELKTPITSIMGYADTLLEGEYDKETQEKFLNVIASEARRMARLVTDLLTLSRYDNNKKRVRKESFDLGDLVKKCQDKLAIEIKKKNHTVNCFVTADVPPVYADKYDIERVNKSVTNLAILLASVAITFKNLSCVSLL